MEKYKEQSKGVAASTATQINDSHCTNPKTMHGTINIGHEESHFDAGAQGRDGNRDSQSTCIRYLKVNHEPSEDNHEEMVE